MGLLDNVKKSLGLTDKGNASAARQAAEDAAAVGVSSSDRAATEAATAQAASQQEAANVAGMQAARQTEADIDGSESAQQAQEAHEAPRTHEAPGSAASAEEGAMGDDAMGEEAAGGGTAVAEDGTAARRVTEVVVEPGDTMSGIAAQFGVDLATLIEENADTVPNPNVIYPGQVLRLP